MAMPARQPLAATNDHLQHIDPDAQSLPRPSDSSAMSLRAHALNLCARDRSLLHGQQPLRRALRQAVFSQGHDRPHTRYRTLYP